ncbi:MAG: MerR family transcriptional regulator [Alphaproteobacteria bacterium]|nr:MerR family transcriptional regulator [Alphaproteobacteria bacterium]
MKTYQTAQIACSIGIHSNTVRLYEKLGLISKPERKSNGYRVFTDLHMEQFKLARTALKTEVMQNGLRKLAILIIKTAAACHFDEAIHLTEQYLQQVRREQQNAEEAITITQKLLRCEHPETNHTVLTRKQTADYLQVSMDTLRNWELNGLLTVKRMQNGYRHYTCEDVLRLKIIRSLRLANYSLSAILRMLNVLSENPSADIRDAIDNPKEYEDIISVCDRLLTSLKDAEENALMMFTHLHKLKNCNN